MLLSALKPETVVRLLLTRISMLPCTSVKSGKMSVRVLGLMPQIIRSPSTMSKAAKLGARVTLLPPLMSRLPEILTTVASLLGKSPSALMLSAAEQVFVISVSLSHPVALDETSRAPPTVAVLSAMRSKPHHEESEVLPVIVNLPVMLAIAPKPVIVVTLALLVITR